MAAQAAAAGAVVVTLAALTAAVLWYTYVVKDPAKVAELSRQIDALLEEINNLFKGQPLPGEVEEAKRQAEEALRKARDKKPDPDPKPYPFPIPPPNRGPDPYERDRKRDECEKKKKQYRWGTYSEVRAQATGAEESHHVLQDKYFGADRGYGSSKICGAYHHDDAPSIPLRGPSTELGQPHYDVTRAQQRAARAYENRYKETGQRPTYNEVFQDGMQQAATYSDLRSDPLALACLAEYINDYFARNCPDLASKPLRIPWMRGETGP